MLKTANPILNKALAGKRISKDEALELFKNASLLDLAYTANEIRRKFHPDNEPATYVVQRNVNYTNICTASCSFCAFYSFPTSSSQAALDGTPAYTHSYDELHQKIKELREIGGTEILLQGGHNPKLGLDYYVELFKKIKKDFPAEKRKIIGSDKEVELPAITLHALSPAEIQHITEKEITPAEDYGDGTKRSKILEPSLEQIKETLIKLKEAGMDSLPGAGAEILTERVREIIAPLKISSQRWLDIMKTAHEIGFKTSATMMYGHVESYEDRIEHLEELRELQDKTNGFTAFVAWNFQRGETPLGKIMDSQEKQGILPEYNKNSSGEDHLRTIAIARIFLDNFKNFQASWVTQGTQVGQASLDFGCNDLGGNMMEENVVSAANTTHRASVSEMRYYIEATGREAKQRDTQYTLLA